MFEYFEKFTSNLFPNSMAPYHPNFERILVPSKKNFTTIQREVTQIIDQLSDGIHKRLGSKI